MSCDWSNMPFEKFPCCDHKSNVNERFTADLQVSRSIRLDRTSLHLLELKKNIWQRWCYTGTKDKNELVSCYCRDTRTQRLFQRRTRVRQTAGSLCSCVVFSSRCLRLNLQRPLLLLSIYVQAVLSNETQKSHCLLMPDWCLFSLTNTTKKKQSQRKAASQSTFEKLKPVNESMNLWLDIFFPSTNQLCEKSKTQRT